MAINFASLRFRAAIRKQGLEDQLTFKNWTYPYGPFAAVFLNGFLILVQGWTCFSPTFKPVDFVSFYIEIPLMLVMYLGWKIFKRTKMVSLDEMDLLTDRYEKPRESGDGSAGAVTVKRGWKEKVKRAGQWLFL